MAKESDSADDDVECWNDPKFLFLFIWIVWKNGNFHELFWRVEISALSQNTEAMEVPDSLLFFPFSRHLRYENWENARRRWAQLVDEVWGFSKFHSTNILWQFNYNIPFFFSWCAFLRLRIILLPFFPVSNRNWLVDVVHVEGFVLNQQAIHVVSHTCKESREMKWISLKSIIQLCMAIRNILFVSRIRRVNEGEKFMPLTWHCYSLFFFSHNRAAYRRNKQSTR